MKAPLTPMIIAVTGFAESGKDTVAERLVEAHGFVRDAFADDVKKAALTLDPWIRTDAEHDGFERLSRLVERLGWTIAKQNPEVRTTLQRIGSEIGWMMHGPQLWTDIVEDRMPGKLAGAAGLVLPDLRFPHEQDWLRRVNGILVRVDRGAHRGTDASTSGHVSETWMSQLTPDVTLRNDSTITVLHERVDNLMAQLT